MVLKFVGSNLDAAYHTTVLCTHNRQPFIANLLADSSLSLITVVDHMTQSEIVPNEVTQQTPAEVKTCVKDSANDRSLSLSRLSVVSRRTKSNRTMEAFPYFSRVPVVDKAFNYDSQERNKTELVIFLKPTIVQRSISQQPCLNAASISGATRRVFYSRW